MNCYIHPILTKKDDNKFIYKTLIKNDEIPTSKPKWESVSNNNIDWDFIYSYVFKYTRDTYIQWLQTRIVHRILATNTLLFKMKIKQNNLCTFCQMQEETISHLFWECCRIKPIIQFLNDEIILFNPNFKINMIAIILGCGKKEYIPIDILFLEFKKYIYLCKRKEILPSTVTLKNSLKFAWEIYFKSGITEIENKSWEIVKKICLQT